MRRLARWLLGVGVVRRLLRWWPYWVFLVLPLVLGLGSFGWWWRCRVLAAPTSRALAPTSDPATSASAALTSASTWSVDDYGVFGDAMAPVTAIATIATFVAALVGLLLQRSDVADESAAQAALTKQQGELVEAEKKTVAKITESLTALREQTEATAQALEKSVQATRHQVNALLAQQGQLTTAFTQLALEQQQANALARHQSRQKLLENAVETASFTWNMVTDAIEVLDRALSRRAGELIIGSGDKDEPRMVARQDAAKEARSWIAQHLNVEADLKELRGALIQHQAADPGTERDLAGRIREMRERWQTVNNGVADRISALEELLDAIGFFDERRVSADTMARARRLRSVVAEHAKAAIRRPT